jgi:hypothetical protein
MANSHIYGKGEETYVVKVTLSKEHVELAKRLGNGYASTGLREALDYYVSEWNLREGTV